MTDPATFEARLSAAYEAYAEVVSSDFDAAEIAQAAWRQPADGAPRAAAGGRGWLLPALVALLALAALGVALAIGASMLFRAPPIGPDFDGAYRTLTDAQISAPSDATVLGDGRIATVDATAVEVHDSRTGGLQQRADLLAPRPNLPRLQSLADGRLLVLDGDAFPDRGSTTTAERFDPATGRVEPAGPMLASRSQFGSAALPDGRVLISGGADVDGAGQIPVVRAVHASAEIFDPASDTFSPTGAMAQARVGHTLTPLADGRVLVAGGRADLGLLSPVELPPPILDLELFDPATGTFSPAGTMSEPDLQAVLPLPDGRAMLVHGSCLTSSLTQGLVVPTQARPATTELFDPAVGAQERGPELPHCVDAAAVLPNGLVFLQGFWSGAPGSSGSTDGSWSGLLDPATGQLRLTDPPAPYPRQALALPDGTVVLVPGLGARGPWEAYH